jgi:hypothetical protein
VRDQRSRVVVPVRAWVGIEQKRQLIGFQAGVGVSHQHSQGILPDDVMKLFDTGFCKLRREVHEEILVAALARIT